MTIKKDIRFTNQRILKKDNLPRDVQEETRGVLFAHDPRKVSTDNDKVADRMDDE